MPCGPLGPVTPEGPEYPRAPFTPFAPLAPFVPGEHDNVGGTMHVARHIQFYYIITSRLTYLLYSFLSCGNLR